MQGKNNVAQASIERRTGTDRRTLVCLPGGRGAGPSKVLVLRSQLIEHHIDDQVAWAEVAEAAEKVAVFARAKQKRAWDRMRSWDGQGA